MDKILDLIKHITERYGVKWLIAGIGIYVLYNSAMKSLCTVEIVVGVCVIELLYFTVRHLKWRLNKPYKEK